MNKNLIILILLSFCSCVASAKTGDTALRKVASTIFSPNDRDRKVVKLIYFRNNRKILINEQWYYKEKLDGPAFQKIIINNRILMEVSKYKKTLIYNIFPTNKYDVAIICEDGHLKSVTVSKDSKYVELFIEEDGLLIPVSDLELKKAIKVTEFIKENLSRAVQKLKEKD